MTVLIFAKDMLPEELVRPDPDARVDTMSEAGWREASVQLGYALLSHDAYQHARH